ncbi:MAG: hypothetical protein WC359_12490 [Dehalococcoidia bacterium]|jgi:hypothetical protein
MPTALEDPFGDDFDFYYAPVCTDGFYGQFPDQPGSISTLDMEVGIAGRTLPGYFLN